MLDPMGCNRVRETVEPATSGIRPQGQKRWAHQGITYTYNFEGYSSGYKRIADQWAPYGKGIWPFRPVRIDKLVRYLDPYWYGQSPVPSFCGSALYPAGSYLSSDCESYYFLTDLESQLPSDFSGIPNSAWVTLGEKWQNVLPDLAGGPDLFVFIAEITDIASLLQRRYVELSAKGAVTTASELHIQNAFVLKPLINDIKQLTRRFATLQKRARRIVDFAGKLLAAAASVSGTSVVSESSTPIDANWCIGRSGVCPAGGYVKTTVRSSYSLKVGGRFTYELPIFMQILNSGKLSYIDMMDLDLDAEAIWELIPFSFVVDWFLNTSKFFAWLKSFSGNELKVNMHDLYVKCYEEVSVSRQIVACHSSDTRYVKRTRLVRQVGPKALTDQLPWFKWPSFLQYTYGAALSWLLLHRKS